MWKSFKELEIWKLGHKLRLEMWQLTNDFPKEEKFVLVPQARRAVHSICANIAEGYGIYHYAESIHHFYIARGSVEEVKDVLIVSKNLNYISNQEFEKLNDLCQQLVKGINGYINYIKKQKDDDV